VLQSPADGSVPEGTAVTPGMPGFLLDNDNEYALRAAQEPSDEQANACIYQVASRGLNEARAHTAPLAAAAASAVASIRARDVRHGQGMWVGKRACWAVMVQLLSQVLARAPG